MLPLWSVVAAVAALAVQLCIGKLRLKCGFGFLESSVGVSCVSLLYILVIKVLTAATRSASSSSFFKKP